MIRPQSALLVIDMQKESFTSATPRFDAAGVVSKINQLAQQFRLSNQSVIYLQHDGEQSGICEKGSEDWEILDEINQSRNDLFIDKYANDCFYNSELETILRTLKIRNLYLTGCATDFCVESTLQSALTKDYDVTVISDAHTTADRPNLTAEQVVKHYNWVWTHMLPTKSHVKVLMTNEVIEPKYNLVAK